MKKILAVAGAAVALALAGAAPASAAGEVCYDVSVVVNGSAVVAEKACTPVG